MRGIETASFFCEPRVSGDHVLIKQHRADKVLSICQIAVYEEAEGEYFTMIFLLRFQKTFLRLGLRLGQRLLIECS